MSVLDAILRGPADRIVMRDAVGVVTRGELAARVGRMATRLADGRDLAGERVAVLAEPGVEQVAALLAILSTGAIAVPLSSQYPASELAWFCDDAEAATVVVSAPYAELARAAGEERRVLPLETLGVVGVPAATPSVTRPGDIAILVYTSGTTGKPKGAMLTHGGVATQTEVLASAWSIGPDDRLLHVLPLHHVHGLLVALLTTLAAGGAVHLLPRFAVDDVLAALPEATLWMAVPTMYQKLREATAGDDGRVTRAAAGLRLAVSGSAALPVGVATWWAERTGAIPLERYGMTETGIVLSNPLGPDARRRGSVGRPLPTFDVRIVDDDGADDGSGPGELQVRGPSLFAGYWRAPAATAAAYTADGWFRTGDRAERDPDGSFRLLGRSSVDVIKSGGYKISALQIEDVLRDHPAIADVAVVGLPDETWGERVVAAVVAREPFDADGVRTWARERLAAYQVPKEIVAVEDLPRNALGKCVKPTLIALLRR